MRNGLSGVTNRIIENELVLLLVAVPLIVAPGSYSWRAADGWPGPLVWLALGLMALPWLLRWLFNGGPTKATILDAPLVFLLLAMGIGLWVSIDPSVTLRWVLVLIAGIAVYYGLVNGLGSEMSVWLGVGAWLACAALLSFALLGQFAWMRNGGAIESLLQRIKGLGRLMPETISPWLDPGIAAGLLSMAVPPAVALAAAVGQASSRERPALRWVLVSTCAELAIVLVACVLLARSWGEMVALAITAVVLPCLYSRRWRLVVAALIASILLALALFWIIGTPTLRCLLPLSDWLRPVYPSRWEVWTRAIYMVEAYPFTGIGMGTFATIAQNNFPYFDAALNQLPHAHNLYLQAALDGGVLAVLALISLVVIFYVGAWRSVNGRPLVAHSRERTTRLLQIGLVGGFTVFLISGVFDDAILTDPAASFGLWTLLGLAESARQARPVRTPVPEWASGHRPRAAWGAAIVVLILIVMAASYLLPLTSLFHNNMGNICRDHGWLASKTRQSRAAWAISALDNYRLALSSGRGAGLGYRSWGDLLYRSRHPEEAIMRLTGTPGYAATDSRMAFWSEVTRLTEGENAIIYLERAAWQRPGDILAHLLLAEAYRAEGEPVQAAREYRLAGVPMRMLLGEATYFAGSGDTNLAATSLRIAHLLWPNSAEAWQATGALSFQQEAYDRAVESFEEAISLAPQRADLHWWLGEAYRRWGKWDEALAAFEKAVSLAPDEARYHYSLARAYRKTGHREEAIRSYERALSLDPDDQVASRELAELRGR